MQSSQYPAAPDSRLAAISLQQDVLLQELRNATPDRRTEIGVELHALSRLMEQVIISQR
jgi:hypothetical protein